MDTYIGKLISISSNPLFQGELYLSQNIKHLAGNLSGALESILIQKNGFFTFENALRFFPSETSKESIGLFEWNSEILWRDQYNGLADNCLFFAEDIFGGQFCIKDNTIFSFEPETGEFEKMADSFDDWAQIILNDFNVWTGYSLAHEWQEKNSVLTDDMRLVPKIPFVCGGEYQLNNLAPMNAVTGMRTRANLARQIAEMPDGTELEFEIID